MRSEEEEEEERDLRLARDEVSSSVWHWTGLFIPFSIPLIGALVWFGLYLYYSSLLGSIELLVRVDGEVTPLWDSDLVRRIVLVGALSCLSGVGLVWMVVRILRRYARLAVRLGDRYAEKTEQDDAGKPDPAAS